jgi:diguanylate cyclase
MATLKYTESSVESRELLKQAITFIGAHQLSANPVNYTVCYEYLLGTQPLLKQAINQAILDNSPLTDLMMEHWFETFLSEYDLASLRQSQADLIEVISALTEATVLAEESVNQFGQTLRHSEKELVDPNSSLESIVAHLLASTKSTQASMELMGQQIQESRQEIAALRDRLEKVTEEALIDPLTGLINRKGLSKAIEVAVLSVEGLMSYPCLLMIDIDHFKKINDTYGHLLGDRVIKVVGETIKRQIKGKDTAARYGGEEFCVLLPETELRDAVKVAENIRLAVEKTRIKRFSDQQEICRMTISIGVARYIPEKSMTDLFERADRALYRSKNGGRNRVTFLQ